MRGLRLVLDVEVRSGKPPAATHGWENLWRVWDSLPVAGCLWLMCGDSSYGHEGLLAEGAARQQKYLFRLRQTAGGKQLVQTLERQSGWKAAHAQSLLTNLSLFLSGLKNTAEQWSPSQCWERIWARILTPLLTPRVAPSG